MINNIDTFLLELKKKVFSSQINLGSFLSIFHWNKEISLDYISNKHFFELNNFFESQEIFFYDFSKLDDKEFIVYFALSKEKLYIFKNYFDLYIAWDNTKIISIWKYLWFPDCCTSNFYDFFENIKIKDMKYYMFDFIKNIFKNSDNFNKYLDIFKEERQIFHSPCLFCCKDSVRLWIDTRILLSKYNIKVDINEYEYLFFKTNDFIRLDKTWKYISDWVYYEYNEKADRSLFYNYRNLIISNWWYFKECIIEDNDKVLYIKFN